MRKIVFFMVIATVGVLCTSAQNGWESINAHSNQNRPYRKIRLRKAQFPDVLTVKDGMVWLSEKPNGEVEGYYGIQTANGFLYNGSKEKVKTSAMKSLSDGWFEFDFEKDLYILEVKDFAHLENVLFLPSGSVSSSSSGNMLSNNSNERKEQTGQESEEEIIPPLEILKPRTPAEEGWTLVDKSKITENVILEHCTKEVEDDEVHLYSYKKENGDFLNNNTKKFYGEEENPYYVDGDYIWTFENGVQKLRKGEIKQTKYPNGNVEQEQENNNRQDKNKGHYLYLPDNPNKGYRYYEYQNTYLPIHAYEVNNSIADVFQSYKISGGFLIKDRFYGIDEMGNLQHLLQKINGKFFPACPTDTIIEIRESFSNDTTIESFRGEYKMCEVLYKNGDRYKIVGTKGGADNYWDYYHVATLHRENGIIRIMKNGEISYRLNDGSKFVFAFDDRFNFFDARLSFTLKKILQAEDPAMDIGWLTDANGNEEFYEYGKSESQKKKEAEEADAKEKAKQIQRRNYYIKKYGYYPGDGKTIYDVLKAGRRFGAIEEFFNNVSLANDRGAAKRYKVKYNQFGSYAYVWVNNGIITSVTF